MGIARRKQNLQDWITQQWVIWFGKKIENGKEDWLLGPFGNTNGIGLKFINQLAEREELIIANSMESKGLIQSIDQLNLSKDELDRLSKDVIDFYEHTSDYSFELQVHWNPFFKFFGVLLRLLFSNRIEQLNVPIENIRDAKALTSEIIQLLNAKTNEVKRTIWLRTFATTGQVVYSGVYGTCKIPSGQSCIKAVFPLPNGNATVILSPGVGKNGELVLTSAGKKFGDSGFYFLVNDSKGKTWAKYIKSFEDNLVASSVADKVFAEQRMTIWKLRVLKFEYSIKKMT